MSDELLQELISAYVDGELSADERSRAEQVLASSEELRRYHEDLLQMRASLAGLPRYRMSADFAASVMQQAERAMLRRSEVAGEPPRTEAPAKPNSGASRMPRVVWAVLSLAATLLIAAAIYFSQGGAEVGTPLAEQQVRPVPQDDRPSPVANSSEAIDLATDQAGETPALGDQRDGQRGARNVHELAENAADLAGRPDAPVPPEATRGADGAADQVARAEMPANSDGDAAGALPVYTLVVEIVLSPRGQQEKTFHTALERAQIPWKNQVAIDRRLSNSLLQNRMFGPLTAEQLPEPMADEPLVQAEGSEEQFELVLVVARGPQIVELMTEIEDRRLTGHVVAMNMDLAMGTSESDLAVQLNQLVLSSAPADPELIRAHPLSLEDEVRSQLSAALHAGKAKLRAEQQQGQDALSDNRNPNALPQAAGTNDAVPQQSMLEVMDQMQFPVLYVLRSEAQVRGSAESPDAN